MKTEGLGFFEVLDIIDAYERYIDWSVREQLDSLTSGDHIEINPNAVIQIKKFLETPIIAATVDPDELEEILEVLEED